MKQTEPKQSKKQNLTKKNQKTKKKKDIHHVNSLSPCQHSARRRSKYGNLFLTEIKPPAQDPLYCKTGESHFTDIIWCFKLSFIHNPEYEIYWKGHF